MIHQISLAECLDPSAPPDKVLNVSALDDTVFVHICTAEQDHQSETHTEVAEISVSLPALLEALSLLANDQERENLRPIDHTGQGRETKLAGSRLTVAATGPSAAVGAVTTHLRYTSPPPRQDARESGDLA